MTALGLVCGLCGNLVAGSRGEDDAKGAAFRFCHEFTDVDELRKAQLEELRALGEPARRALLELAGQKSSLARECAWAALARDFRDPRVLPILRRALVDRDESAEDRGDAAVLLGAMNDASAFEMIVGLLDEEATWSDAVHALGELKGERAQRTVRQLMLESLAKGTEEKPYRRGALLGAIGHQRNDEMIPLVLADLERSERTDHSRYFACRTLAEIGTRASLSTMLEIFDGIQNRYTRDEIARFAIEKLTELKAKASDAGTLAFCEETIERLTPCLLWGQWLRPNHIRRIPQRAVHRWRSRVRESRGRIRNRPLGSPRRTPGDENGHLETAAEWATRRLHGCQTFGPHPPGPSPAGPWRAGPPGWRVPPVTGPPGRPKIAEIAADRSRRFS